MTRYTVYQYRGTGTLYNGMPTTGTLYNSIEPTV